MSDFAREAEIRAKIERIKALLASGNLDAIKAAAAEAGALCVQYPGIPNLQGLYEQALSQVKEAQKQERFGETDIGSTYPRTGGGSLSEQQIRSAIEAVTKLFGAGTVDWSKVPSSVFPELYLPRTGEPSASSATAATAHDKPPATTNATAPVDKSDTAVEERPDQIDTEETLEAPAFTTQSPLSGLVNTNRTRPIPKGGMSIEERIVEGGNPPPHVRANPDKYYYEPESRQYPRRPEPTPEFSVGGEQRAIPCFPKGTLVATTAGPVPIELLNIGTKVRAFDELSQAQLDKPITALLQNKTVRLVDITTDKETLCSTTRHRFWVENKEQWVPAQYLEPGMLLQTVHGEVSEVENIFVREVLEQDTYNLTVADCHTYFVGRKGFLVHNADEVPKGKIYIGYDSQGNPIYIGQTKQDLLERQVQHHDDAIKKPEKYGFKKDMRIEQVPGMDGLTDEQMDYHERRLYDELGGKDKLKNRIEPMGDEKINALIEKYCS